MSFPLYQQDKENCSMVAPDIENGMIKEEERTWHVC